jgi:hypothetical protein
VEQLTNLVKHKELEIEQSKKKLDQARKLVNSTRSVGARPAIKQFGARLGYDFWYSALSLSNTQKKDWWWTLYRVSRAGLGIPSTLSRTFCCLKTRRRSSGKGVVASDCYCSHNRE